MKKPGMILQWFGITNPFGFVLGHKIKELGINRKQLAADSGIRHSNYISMLTRPNGSGASFATQTGPLLVKNLLAAEKKRPELLLPGERKNFSRRERAVTDAMILLSIYSSGCRQGDNPHELFTHFASIVPAQTYRNALTLVGEALLGPFPQANTSTTMGVLLWEEKVKFRRYMAESLYDFEDHHRALELFETRGKPEIEKGDPAKAIREMMGGFEGMQEEAQAA